MGCGVLEDNKLSHVPGTALFSEDPNKEALATYQGVDVTKLQHATGRYSDIILVPQPSRVDPNDPLLWPMWKKHLFFLILVYGTTLCGAVGPLVSADQVHIASLFDVSTNRFAQIYASVYTLVLGISTIVLQVFSVKLGKRPTYMVTSVLLCVSAVWSSEATSFPSFAGARMLMGFAIAPLEFLVGASINDIYYVHERSVPIAIWNLALINGINITPPIAGQILNVESLGFRWAYRFFAIATGVLCILQYFFMPETTFFRESVVRPHQIPSGSTEGTEEKARIETVEVIQPSFQVKKKGYMASLAMFNGVYPTKVNVVSLLLRPMYMFFTPIILWGGLLYGMAITYLVLFAVSVSVIFGAPPYNFTAAQVGLTYMGPFISAALATLIAGPITNWCARVLSRRNKGIYEPEFKLLPVVLYAIFGIMGFVGFGISLQRGQPWISPVVFNSIAVFGIVLGTTSALSYIIDSHRHTTDAALGSLIFHKNIWSFGLAWNFVDFILDFGPEKVFNVVAAGTAAACVLTIPMYIFGKRVRSWVHRHVHFSEEDETSAVAH
ncbi:MFS general substrate transporter [Mycena chlorophos]|uniref:MFS general substrate transporter n=1 Tax=Mycena chlorophos TaxID=658473 RepID=A0A8H6W4L2_MYCCL|nr:MFS general substrate transporter [Mycena chlorophos]